MRSPRRLPIVAALALVMTLSAVLLTGVAGPHGPFPAATAGAQIVEDEQTDEAPGLGNIIGTPEAGPAPEDAGDRGGWAQLFLAVVVFGGIGFIASRIARGLRPPRP